MSSKNQIRANDFYKMLNKFEKDILEKQLKNYSTAGKEAMKEIRTNITNEWFAGFSSSSLNIATEYHSYTRIFDEMTARIYITSHISIDKYNPSQNAAKWNQQHSDEVNMQYDSREYVISLQWYKGIIGLPETSTARGLDWINDHFHQKEPLKSYTENHYLWSQWENYVNKYL